MINDITNTVSLISILQSTLAIKNDVSNAACNVSLLIISQSKILIQIVVIRNINIARDCVCLSCTNYSNSCYTPIYIVPNVTTPFGTKPFMSEYISGYPLTTGSQS